MREEINMIVSGVVTKEGKKSVYVQFTDEDCMAEGKLPECKIISNNGFREEDVKALEVYMEATMEQIFEKAKEMSIMKAFLGN